MIEFAKRKTLKIVCMFSSSAFTSRCCMLRYRNILVAVVFAVCSLVSVAAELPVYRLSGDVVPLHYNLILSTDLDQFVFNGSVDIKIECKKATKVIKIHSKSLDIAEKSVTLSGVADNSLLAVSGVASDDDNDFLVIKVNEGLVPGYLYTLHVKFKGNLTDSLMGYYRSSYLDKATNTTKWLAVTQFEATDARRAFPCFDEPAMKAKFRIRLGHRSELHSVSNMFLSSSARDKERPGWVWDRYEDSVPMSTYLVAFLVSDFQSKQAHSHANNVLFRVWARKDAIDQTKFALDYNPKFLAFFEDFFKIKFPLGKLDSVALPDFSSGAMENWGLVTYRESSFLVDEKTTPVRVKYNVANTIAHELSHMWFGNLVTMKWWTDLWLNEGFASYVTRLAVEREFPEWNAYNFEVTSDLIFIFALDALKSSHPVSVPIGHPDEIRQIFDHISYSKGAFLLYMMNGFLGDKVFRRGITRYLKHFSYGNSETDDLWGSLTAERGAELPPGQTVKSVMDTWTSQTGYPLVTVRRDRGRIYVSQKRYLAVRPTSGEEPKECWWIPLTFSTASSNSWNDTRSTHWLGCGVQELAVNTEAQPDDWIILNNKAAGLFRVNYDHQTWTLLVNALNTPDFATIHELNRMQLVLDSMSLAKVGLLEYPLALKLLGYIRQERAHNPWRAADTSLREIEMLLWRTQRFDEFKKFVHNLLSETYNKFSDLTAVPEGFEEIKQKEMIVKLACDYEVGDCLQKADQLFKDWMSTGINTIPKDLRSTVYCVGVRNGGQYAWDHVWNQYQSSNVASDKNLFLRALACTENSKLLTRCLTQSIEATSGIRRQDAGLVFVSVAQTTRVGYRLAHEFLVENAQRIYDHLAPNTASLGSYFTVLTRRMVFPEEVAEMKSFVATSRELLKNAQMQVDQALELAESNIKWMERFYNTISKALVV